MKYHKSLTRYSVYSTPMILTERYRYTIPVPYIRTVPVPVPFYRTGLSKTKTPIIIILITLRASPIPPFGPALRPIVRLRSGLCVSNYGA